MNTSNKTQRTHDEKTAWAPKFWLLVGLLVILVAPLPWFVKQPTVTLSTGGKQFTLSLATTEAEQERGLSYRKSLPENQGMLFEFQTSSVQCFWMKAMEFPLDMIWLNSSKEVVHIQSDVSPNTYPHSFCPPEPAQYVIELNAGEAATSKIELGQTLNF